VVVDMSMETSHSTVNIGTITISHDQLADAGRAFIKSLNLPPGGHEIGMDIHIQAQVNKGAAYESSIWQSAKPEQLLLLAVAMSGAVGDVLTNIAGLGYEEYVSRVNEIESRSSRLSGRNNAAAFVAAETAEAKHPNERTDEENELVMCLKAYRQQSRIDSVIETLRRSTRATKSGRTDIPNITVQMIR
jgi:hypothetical protein